jgi:hypothetical protein
MIFWKEAWIKPVSHGSPKEKLVSADSLAASRSRGISVAGCSEADVIRSAEVPPDGTPVTYVCQATRLPYASSDLEWWQMSQYVEDYRSGNVSLWQLFCGGVYFFFQLLSNAGIGMGRPIRWIFDHCYSWWGGSPYPRRSGIIPPGEPTPVESLNLQPGELVRVKPYREILKTLGTDNRNRGLYFDAEEVPYCGKTYRVLRRVDKIVNERTGKMQAMKTPSIILDTVICEGRYSECRLLCPRSIYSFWREIWLERVGPSNTGDLEIATGRSLSAADK